MSGSPNRRRRPPKATHKPGVEYITQEELVLRLLASQSQEMKNTLDRMYKKYKKHLIPVDELRALLDKDMGDTTLTQFLHEMREVQYPRLMIFNNLIS